MRSNKSDELFYIKPIAKRSLNVKKLIKGRWPQ